MRAAYTNREIVGRRFGDWRALGESNQQAGRLSAAARKRS
jgi:hypothetical protein